MRTRLLVGLLVLMSAAGAYCHLSVGPRPLDKLLKKPANVSPDGMGGLAYADPQGPLASAVETGRVTVFVLLSDRIPDCQLLHAQLRGLSYLRPDVAIRIIRLPDDWHRQDLIGRWGLHVSRLPHVVILGADGGLVAMDQDHRQPALDLLREWMGQEAMRSM